VAVRRQPVKGHLLQDLLRLGFFVLIAVTVVSVALYPPPSYPLWLDRTGRVLLGLASEVLLLAIIRECVPRPAAGSHMVGANKEYIRWLVSSAFADVAMNPMVRFPFWMLHSTRVLYLKALGTQISWNVGFHEDFVLREPALVEIAPGAQLEPGVVLEAALHGAGRVRIAPIIIGGGCLVGAHAILMPGATLGHDATVAPGAFLGENVHVGVGAKIGEGARIERGVDLGSYTSVGTGAIISEGVRVGDRARIGSGAVVEPNTSIGERELWEGAPARCVSGEPRSIAAV
jgi:acetyltransferase-like isoleucine patch superfamily enzyme